MVSPGCFLALLGLTDVKHSTQASSSMRGSAFSCSKMVELLLCEVDLLSDQMSWWVANEGSEVQRGKAPLARSVLVTLPMLIQH